MRKKHAIDPSREREKKEVAVPLVDGRETPGLSRGITKGINIWSSKQRR